MKAQHLKNEAQSEQVQTVNSVSQALSLDCEQNLNRGGVTAAY